MTKTEKEELEYKSLFTDKRYAQKAWQKFIGESLEAKAVMLPSFEDAKGNVSPQSVIYDAAVAQVRKRLKERGIDRDPMQAEVLIEANVIRAAFDNNVFNTILERSAGKVKDELEVSRSDYEHLTDEELALLAKHREDKKLLEAGGDNDTNSDN